MPGLPGFLDQSQQSNWDRCPAYWLERYVHKMGKPHKQSEYRDDAASIGSLTHAGLEEFEKRSVVEVPQWAIDEIRPTPEALTQALELVTAYALHGEAIPWKLKWFEEPLRKTIKFEYPCRDEGMMVPYDILAKVDFAFYVDAPTEIRTGTGIEQSMELLQPGFWIKEYKTKSASRPRGQWMQEWVMKGQADFQLLTLQEFANTQDVEHKIARGILVTVLEYEKQTAPKRKCRGCHLLQPFVAYTPNPDGTFRCMDCGHSSKLAAIKDKDIPAPNIWYLPVYRREEILRAVEANAIKKIRDMHAMVEGTGPGWNTGACSSFYGACDYLDAHQNWQFADAQSGYVQIETMKYMTQGKEVVENEVVN